MTEIQLWHAGDDKIRMFHTTTDVLVVCERISACLKTGNVFSVPHPVDPGEIFASAELLRSCVITVREVIPDTEKVQ